MGIPQFNLNFIDTKFSQDFSGIMKLTAFLAVLFFMAIAKSEANPAGSGLQTKCSGYGGPCGTFGPYCCNGKCDQATGQCLWAVKNACKPFYAKCNPKIAHDCCSFRCVRHYGDYYKCKG